jgi:hypothetical protein
MSKAKAPAKAPAVHVVPNKKEGVWHVKQDKKIIKTARLKKTILKEGREKAIDDKTELVEHGRDGKIMSKNSFGNDPNPPKG